VQGKLRISSASGEDIPAQIRNEQSLEVFPPVSSPLLPAKPDWRPLCRRWSGWSWWWRGSLRLLITRCRGPPDHNRRRRGSTQWPGLAPHCRSAAVSKSRYRVALRWTPRQWLRTPCRVWLYACRRGVSLGCGSCGRGGAAETGTSPLDVMTCQSPLKNRPRRDPSKMVLWRHTGLVAPNGGRGSNLSLVSLGGWALGTCPAKRCGRWWTDRVADCSH